MNHESETTNAMAAGCRARMFWQGLKAGCFGAMRLFWRCCGMQFIYREAALQKRDLERRLIERGFSRRLAMIAASEAFRPTAKPE